MKKIIDYCTNCMREVELDAVLKQQTCPVCYAPVIPCASMCEEMVRVNCSSESCPLNKEK